MGGGRFYAFCQRKQLEKSMARAIPFAIVGMDSARVAPQQSSILSPLEVILLDQTRKIKRDVFDQKCNNFLEENVLDMGSTIHLRPFSGEKQ